MSMKGISLLAAVGKLKSYAPLCLAEKWDNVGLLIEPSAPKIVESIILTNDLTLPVVFEAIAKKVDMIISYHPPIFSSLKKVTQESWKQELVVRCIENRIALFSPHTCYDALNGGVNDWLMKPFEFLSINTIENRSYGEEKKAQFYFKVVNPSAIPEPAKVWLEQNLMSAEIKDETFYLDLNGYFELLNQVNKFPTLFECILPVQRIDSFAGCGVGRIGKLKHNVSLLEVVEKMKSLTGNKYIRLAVGYDAVTNEMKPSTSLVSSIAVCAGSGASVLKGVEADVYITGEMSHHDILDATHSGSHVILLEHCNSERGFLKPLCLELERLFENKINVMVSEKDHSPLQIV